ncbi:MAG TPA: hypothetical protein VFO70_08385 [Chitinophagaceae bacterium]|nr:hypothetical protein [Chitinophagaceae bacterium]
MPVRIIVNNKEIYPLLNDKPVVIPVEHNYPRIVATDGYHYTQPLELKYTEPSYYRFKVSCAIDDLQLLGGGFVLVLLYLIGFFTDIFILKLLSFAPLIWFLVIYYVNRKKFIRIVPVR